MKNHIYIADLTHTQGGIQALTFPLGTAFVATYAKHALGDDFEFKLFKFPDRLSEAINEGSPRVLALSNYSWNLELGCKLAAWAKRRHPNLIVVMGGPNFPVSKDEKLKFLQQRSVVDVYIESEGEVGFAKLLRKLDEYRFDIAAFKYSHERVTNCTYLSGNELIEGGIERIQDVNTIPSPYLTGTMDEFFEFPLSPMIETTRGCPFSCSFCADGLVTKNKIVSFDHNRVLAELNYIAEHVKCSDEINITDLNFGMYARDVETARSIAEIQDKFKWPRLIKGSAGKNRSERIIETATLLKGSWVVGSALQSSDQEVLKNIKRSNISTESFQEFVRFMHSTDKKASTYCEVILALPGDTKAKHFESIRVGVESQMNTVKLYQAMLLSGTDMASQETRAKFGFLTKFRVMAGGVGIYKFGEEEIPVAEIQEIIVGSKDMSFEDYASCRAMCLLIETYYNNSMSEEIFTAMRAMALSVSDFLVYLHEHTELYNATVKAIFDRFDVATRNNLYGTHEEAEAAAMNPDILALYLSGELGFNEVLECKAQLYFEMEETQAVLLSALSMYLAEKEMLTDAVQNYFDQLGIFTLCKKRQIINSDLVIERCFNYDFEAIDALNYEVDPRNIQHAGQDLCFKFFHDQEQKDLIGNAVRMYQNHPGGISRVLYGQNLKKMYRNFERS